MRCRCISSFSRIMYFSVCAMMTSCCMPVPDAYLAWAASSILENRSVLLLQDVEGLVGEKEVVEVQLDLRDHLEPPPRRRGRRGSRRPASPFPP